MKLGVRPIVGRMARLGKVARLGRVARREDGQAIVEVALAMPLLLLLITAIVQFGSMYGAYTTLVDAARTGARELALGRNLTSADPCDPAVAQTMSSTAGDVNLPSGDVTPTFANATGGATTTDYCGTSSSCTYVYKLSCNSKGAEVQGDEAKVTIKYPYTLKILGMKVLNVNLTTSAADAIE
jgi:Flp pilus assembly protein TadG